MEGCIFISAISGRTRTLGERTKFVSVHRWDNGTFLEVRDYYLTSEGFCETDIGVLLTLSEAKTFIELAGGRPDLRDVCFACRFQSGKGQFHALSDNGWIAIGKEVSFLRKKEDKFSGIALSEYEYAELKCRLEIINVILFPTYHPEKVEITQAMMLETATLLDEIRKEKCLACSDKLLRHSCGYLEAEGDLQCYFEEAMRRVDMTRVLKCANYVRDVLQISAPPPTFEMVEEYFKNYDWYLNELSSENSYYFLADSFTEIFKQFPQCVSPNLRVKDVNHMYFIH